MCIFFFFQAEDGIRDLTVTGVQTCALPIFPERDLALLRAAGRGLPLHRRARSGSGLKTFFTSGFYQCRSRAESWLSPAAPTASAARSARSFIGPVRPR